MSVLDERRLPFCWQEHVTVERIRMRFSGRRLAVALAAYMGLTYFASTHFREGGRDGFVAGRKELANFIGVKPDTFDGIAAGLVAAGLLEKRPRTDQYGRDLAPLWVLPSGVPPEDAIVPETGPGGPLAGTPPGESGSPFGVPETGTPTRAGQTKEDVDVSCSTHTGPSRGGAHEAGPGDPRVPATVGSDPVTPNEAQLALAALDAFNEAAGAGFASRDFVASIVRRHREHPDLTAEDHRRLVRESFAQPWWSDTPSPSVIWGNAGIFERAVFRGAKPAGARRTASDYRDAFKSVRSELDD